MARRGNANIKHTEGSIIPDTRKSAELVRRVQADAPVILRKLGRPVVWVPVLSTGVVIAGFFLLREFGHRIPGVRDVFGKIGFLKNAVPTTDTGVEDRDDLYSDGSSRYSRGEGVSSTRLPIPRTDAQKKAS